MRTEAVEVFSDQSNMPVIRYPGRRFPGVLIQGDTLAALCAHARMALGAGHDARDELEDLHAKLSDILEHYIEVLREHELDLPFSRPGEA